MSTLRRGTHKMWPLVENRKIKRESWIRSMSTKSATVIMENGKNGEKIFKSSLSGSTNYPDMPIHEYVWRNIGNWSDKVALKCGTTERKYTYANARDASNNVAKSLLNMGFKSGDVIALILPNLPETAIAFLGSVEAGLIVTTVNPMYTVDEISRQLINSDAKGIITSAEISSTVLKAASPSLSKKFPVIVINDGTKSVPSGLVNFKDLIDRGKSLPSLSNKSWNIDDVAILPYSSGTTGVSKGVMLTHRNIVTNMIQLDRSTAGKVWREAIGNHQDIVPAILPLFHIYGLNSLLLPNLSLGSQLVTLPKFAPETFLNILEKDKVTGLALVPPLILFLVASPNIKNHHLESVRFMTSGAAPIATTDVQRFYEKYQIDHNKIAFYQGYGLTETSPLTLLNVKSIDKYASVGVPVCDSEARLVDPITKEDISTPGETGELWVRGNHVLKGYYKNEEATKETIISGGWLRTGDLAYFDEDLDFFIKDRLKELIKVKGFQVPPAELEALLRTHPDIEEAAVIGISDERYGEVPKAFVLLKKNRTLTEKDVQNFVKGKVSEFKELKGGVEFVETIPKNNTGKILRRLLKESHESK